MEEAWAEVLALLNVHFAVVAAGLTTIGCLNQLRCRTPRGALCCRAPGRA